MEEGEDIEKFIEKLKKLEKDSNSVLVIEGEMLDKVLKDDRLKKDFINYSSYATSVVCCRCAPTQKAELVKEIKKNLDKVIACIGDGGNDVAMIQKADVGIGIEGKEGNQAALSSDFSISEFKNLLPLLLWTGRLSYIRSALLSNFIIHRGLIVSVIQFLYTIIFGLTTTPIFNGYLLLGYATIFTCLPVFCLIFDEDVTYQQVLDFPILYKLLQQGAELGIMTFLGWAWMSIFQGLLIISLSVLLFTTNFLDLVTITFSALILIEMLNIAISIHKYNPMIVISILISIGIYSLCLFVFRSWFLLGDIDANFFLKVLLIVAAAWIPVFMLCILQKWLKPTILQKVRAENLRNPGFDEKGNKNQEQIVDDSRITKT